MSAIGILFFASVMQAFLKTLSVSYSGASATGGDKRQLDFIATWAILFSQLLHAYSLAGLCKMLLF